MALLWGEVVTQQNISDALKKLGISHKKIDGYCERDECKRHEFQERVKTRAIELVAYIDEAGIDNREDYLYGYCVRQSNCPDEVWGCL